MMTVDDVVCVVAVVVVVVAFVVVVVVNAEWMGMRWRSVVSSLFSFKLKLCSMFE